MKLKNVLAGFTGFLMLVAPAMAQTSVSSRYNFVTIDHPGSLDAPLSNYPLGVNNRGAVVGVFIDTMGIEHGYLWTKGKFTTIDYPGAPLVPFGGSGASSINDRGDISGVYTDQNGFQHGYLRSLPRWCGDDEDDDKACKPVFTSIDVPGAAQTHGINFELGPGLGTLALGLNNEGDITGMYATPGLYSNGYSLSHGVFKPYSHPAASQMTGDGTKFFALSNKGVIAGDYLTQASMQAPPITHAFLLDEDGKVTPIEAKDSADGGFGTQVTSVNSSREAVGSYTDPMGLLHAFFWKSGTLFQVDYPGAPFSEGHVISDRGAITGAYSTDGVHTHGFIAIPKEDSRD